MRGRLTAFSKDVTPYHYAHSYNNGTDNTVHVFTEKSTAQTYGICVYKSRNAIGDSMTCYRIADAVESSVPNKMYLEPSGQSENNDVEIRDLNRFWADMRMH